ncbi:MAG TPA: corrinoid protein [Bacteroidota bacterium]|nr:corrinoid protein [Bacteroidota bacterium]
MTSTELLATLAMCVERGKVNAKAPFPPDLKGQDGADELTVQALAAGATPQEVLTQALMVGMNRVGEKFRDKKIFVPDLLMAARAMNASMVHMQPYFKSAEVKLRGTVVIGTVAGDLHDIGKKLVAMMLEGAGWKIVDLGTDVSTQKFIDAVKENPQCVVGMSALLTTTMASMEESVKKVKEIFPSTKVLVGGAPLTLEFAQKIGADFYSPDPQGAVEYLNTLQMTS